MENRVADNGANEAAEMAGGDGNSYIAEMLIGEKDVAGDLFENRFAEDADEENGTGDTAAFVRLLSGFERPEQH